MEAKFKLNSISKLLVLFLCTSFLLSCSEENAVNDKNLINTIESKMNDGEWRVSSYYDFDLDDELTFRNYNLKFHEGNEVTAYNGIILYAGYWSLVSRNANTNGLNNVKLNIVFTEPIILNKLSNSWTIESYSDTELRLTSLSKKKGGLNYVIISKNMIR